ncbi:MAG: bifunctional precorrin-2 dehydrogenase/sirohydrochlorin ferrochelatase [Firmicutes bacterium]|nr:bifunctional precorrin-2 dehydrogenase/sirohydrochlorin ferrochelatase [Bacillota bacterium]
MSGLTVELDLQGAPCGVIGGGHLGLRRVVSFLNAKANVTVISPVLTDDLRALVEEGRIEWESRAYMPGDATRFMIVVAATDDPEVNAKIALEAKRGDRFVQVVDRPQLGTVHVGARYIDTPLTVAVMTGGASPLAARVLAQYLGSKLPADLPAMLTLLGKARSDVLASDLPLDQRRAVLRDIATDASIRQYLNGDKEAVARQMGQALSKVGRSLSEIHSIREITSCESPNGTDRATPIL